MTSPHLRASGCAPHVTRVLGHIDSTDIGQQPHGRWWLLCTVRLPARLRQEDVAVLGGFQVHDIPYLVMDRLLIPLGDQRPNSVKYFAAASVLKALEDPRWLDRATRAVARRGRRTDQPRNTDGAPSAMPHAN